MLNLDLDYFSHPKTKRLVALRGVAAESLPIKLWCAAAKYFPDDGVFRGVSVRELMVGYGGMSSRSATDLLTIWATSMVDVGFLEITQMGDYAVHDWGVHAGHIKRYHEKAKVASAARWNKPKDEPKSDAPSIAPSNTSAVQCSAVLKNKEHSSPKQPASVKDIPHDFVLFWTSYPCKVGKKKALEAWRKAKDLPDIEVLLKAIRFQKKSSAWTKDGGQFIPHPATWLNQCRWDDEVQEAYDPNEYAVGPEEYARLEKIGAKCMASIKAAEAAEAEALLNASIS
jgi:hypothetical protein